MTYIYKTISEHAFVDAFRQADRMDNFSIPALKALFEYLESLASDTGEPVELDVIALCCEWSEYATALEAATEHGYEPDTELDDDEQESAALDWLEERTQVVIAPGGNVWDRAKGDIIRQAPTVLLQQF